jgi:kinesin family protein 5
VKEDFYSHCNNLLFTFDHVLKPSTTQEEAFNVIGLETINDVMNGYNGTIFAYGQTGSGKTYSMYGEDLFDELSMGLIPRAARAIFNHIRS